jgi:hypothetical protein
VHDYARLFVGFCGISGGQSDLSHIRSVHLKNGLPTEHSKNRQIPLVEPIAASAAKAQGVLRRD